jgi:TonB family protein
LSNRRTFIGVVVLVVLAFAGEASTQTPPPDLSPGAIALTALDEVTPANTALLITALGSGQAPVRAAAARVAFTQGRRGLLPQVVLALVREADGDAAIEEARFVAGFGSSDADRLILDASDRVPAPYGREIALLFARARGSSALQYLPRVRQRDPHTISVAGFIRAATGDDAAALENLLAAAVRDRDAALVAASLSAARIGKTQISDAAVLSLLAPTNPVAVRAAGLAQIVVTSAARSSIVDTVRGVILPTLPEIAAESAINELIVELARRLVGEPARGDADWLSLLTARAETLDAEIAAAQMTELISRLSASEYAAYTNAIYGQPRTLPPPAQPAATAPAATVVRLMSGYPHGYVASLIATARCDVARQSKGAGGSGGRVLLRPDGRVARVSLMNPTAAGECTRAVEALLVTYAASPERANRPGQEEILVFPFLPGFVECQDTLVRWQSNLGGAAGSRLKPPTQLNKVQPQYPLSAQEDRVSGVVVVEALITQMGCVAAAEVVRGRDLRLDWAALRAIAAWTYSPMLVEGKPVPTIMKIAVTFTLK